MTVGLGLIGCGRRMSSLGTRLKKHSDTAYYVQHFQKAMGDYFNGGTLLDDQINYSPNSGRRDTIYATLTVEEGDDRYTVAVYYGGNDDRIHFLNFGVGGTRGEEILYKDAENNPGGIVAFRYLRSSGAFGLGKVGTVKVLEKKPEIRRAMLEISWKDEDGNVLDTAQVLAPYMEASNVTGYWIPRKGNHEYYQPADWFSLSGGTVGAGFYMLPESATSDEREITAIISSAFFSYTAFCGDKVHVGDPADELIERLADAGYPCEMVIKYSENRQFITSIADVGGQNELVVTNNQITQVISWLR